MTKLPRLTAREIIILLEKRGFFLARQSGSHMIYRHKDGLRITVPFHGSKILHPKITKRIFEDLKITEKDFPELGKKP